MPAYGGPAAVSIIRPVLEWTLERLRGNCCLRFLGDKLRMPGGGRGRYQWAWIGKPPVYWTVVFWITISEIVVSWVLLVTLPRWAQSVPDASHPSELYMKGGHSYYLAPRLCWFLNNNLWIFFGLLGLFFLIMFVHRDSVERVR